MAAFLKNGGVLSERFKALGEPPVGQMVGSYATYESLEEEFKDMPLSDAVKTALIEELINDDQRRAQEAELPEERPLLGDFVGMYTHVDDGQLGPLRWSPPAGEQSTCLGGAGADLVGSVGATGAACRPCPPAEPAVGAAHSGAVGSAGVDATSSGEVARQATGL